MAGVLNGTATKPRFKFDMRPKAYRLPKFVGTELFPYPLTKLENGWQVAVVPALGPELAQAMLDTRPDNQRSIRQAQVGKLGSDMEAGEWRLTHQGLWFNARGELDDGQHRCTAVVATKVPVPVLVFFGSGKDDEMKVIDTMAPRTAADAATVLRLDARGRDISTVRSMLRRRVGVPANAQFTNSQILAALDQHADALAFVRDQFARSKTERLCNTSVRAAVGCAYYHCDRDRLGRFVQVYMDRVPATEGGDRTPRNLSKFMFTLKSTGGIRVVEEIFAKTVCAIQAHQQGQTLTQIRGLSQNPYPLPDKAA